MAQAIGSLYVSLGLDSAAFSAGVKAVQQQANALASKLGKVAAGIVATAAPAMAAMGVASMNAAAEIQRAARLANAAPAEFQGWAAGAASVGIEQDKLADILKDVNDRVGDFIATGGGPMADFFERVAPKVGVTAAQFRKLSGPQALQLYVDSLEKANLNQQDMTFFMEAMASDSTALLPLLRGNGAAMAEYAAKAQALGAVMDDKTVASFARAKQSLSEVQLAFTGFRNIMAAQIVPGLAAMANAFVTAAQKGHWLGDMVRTVAEAMPRLMSYTATFAGLMAGKWVAAFAAARLATFSLAGALTALRGAIAATGIGAIVIVAGELVYRFMGLVKSAGGFGEALSVLKDLAVEVWDRIGLGASVIMRHVSAAAAGLRSVFAKAFAWILRKVAELTTSVATAINGLFSKAGIDLGLQGGLGAELAGELENYAERQDFTANAQRIAAGKFAADMLAPLKSLELLKSQTEETNEELGRFGGPGGGLAAASSGAGGAKAKLSDVERVMKALREEAEKLQATFNMSDLQAQIWEKQREAGVAAESTQGKMIAGYATQADQLKKLKDATESWRDSISSAFSSFITQGGSFKKVLSEIISKLAEMLMSKAFTSLMGPGTSGGGFLTGVMKMFGFSNGTNFAPGGLARVHERGGEIMNLPRGTQVIPHDISKRMADNASKSQGVSIHIDARGAVEGTAALIEQKIRAAIPQIVNQSAAQTKALQGRGHR
ncbi:hypothetical protein ACFOHK_08180 [Falsigemmobacter intermedius]|uniref:Phage tail tape measure protein n=1 Tax=Falsigemmobacter intermedius TaxID=1553448 RepID=A0A3S3Y3F9_9RHOB|nr:hypothetical protein [Falsigemmobacter intermedius]RWY36426.1 hypothetical protein EP867_17850 [Falsigemmobacter intermedius]